MRHQGSKLREADALAGFLHQLVELVNPPRVEEIFCGSAAVSRELFRRGLTVDALGDARPALISCYRRLRDGSLAPKPSSSPPSATPRRARSVTVARCTAEQSGVKRAFPRLGTVRSCCARFASVRPAAGI